MRQSPRRSRDDAPRSTAPTASSDARSAAAARPISSPRRHNWTSRDVMREPLQKRRELLEQKVLSKLSEPVRYATSLDAALPVLVQSVKAQGFEGLVAKRRNSVYEPALRTGAWMKMRVNRGQEFVIGGYTRGTKTFDALIFGYYDGEN